MNINNILTLEELYKVAISIPNKEYVFDQMDRRNCFECHAAAVITGLNHTMKGFWAFFLPPRAMPIAIRRRMKTHVDKHFADHMENYIARSTEQYAPPGSKYLLAHSTMLSAKQIANIVRNMILVRDSKCCQTNPTISAPAAANSLSESQEDMGATKKTSKNAPSAITSQSSTKKASRRSTGKK